MLRTPKHKFFTPSSVTQLLLLLLLVCPLRFGIFFLNFIAGLWIRNKLPLIPAFCSKVTDKSSKGDYSKMHSAQWQPGQNRCIFHSFLSQILFFQLNYHTSLLIIKVFPYFENPVWKLQVTFSTLGANSSDGVWRPQKFEDCDILAFLCESAAPRLSECICGFPSSRLLFYSPSLCCGRSGVGWEEEAPRCCWIHSGPVQLKINADLWGLLNKKPIILFVFFMALCHNLFRNGACEHEQTTGHNT